MSGQHLENAGIVDACTGPDCVDKISDGLDRHWTAPVIASRRERTRGAID